MNLVGIDIGWSARRKTNGIALLHGATLTVDHMGLAGREAFISGLPHIDIAAVDAPVVHGPDVEQRAVESIFCRGLFYDRCKPGASHVAGTGAMLRTHGSLVARELISHTARTGGDYPRVLRSNIIEAFPNAFLGVAVSEGEYLHRDRSKKRAKFDWLYDCWTARSLFGPIVAMAGLPNQVATRCANERQHDRRAALVCLLTAALTRTGQYVAVGDAKGGYFFLPPKQLWQAWAWRALSTNIRAFPSAEIRVDGELI
jgi:predicted nuclease with RNAse H fold